MKKLMTLMLGLSMVLGSVAVVYGQDTTDTTKKVAKKKKADKTGDQKKAPAKDTSKTGA
jgi:tetrahydromethanopterin S-methyltransferase subunit D